MSKARQVDIIIAGGGMVGASLALQLSVRSNYQLNIMVVESFPLPLNDKQPLHYSPSFDARSTALSYSSRLILEPLGVWDDLSRHIADINHIHVSQRGRFGSTLMHHSDVDWPSLGYVVENSWLGNVLLEQLKTIPTVEFCCPASVVEINPDADGVCCSIEHKDQGADKSTLQRSEVLAQLMVVADGAHSGLRQQLGVTAQTIDYRQNALIANVCFQQAHQNFAYERFTSDGPLALLPLTDSDSGEARAALVWSLNKDAADYLLNCDDDGFLHTLQQQFGHRQGQFTRVGERASYPLQLVEAQEQVRSGIVMMGNAAHSLHPVAGQGFNLALRDCSRLTTLLVRQFATGGRLGDLSLLQHYAEQQQFDQRKTIGLSDRLPALFNSSQLPLSILRSLGLLALDLTPAAKKAFILQAAGMHNGAAIA